MSILFSAYCSLQPGQIFPFRSFYYCRRNSNWNPVSQGLRVELVNCCTKNLRGALYSVLVRSLLLFPEVKTFAYKVEY